MSRTSSGAGWALTTSSASHSHHPSVADGITRNLRYLGVAAARTFFILVEWAKERMPAVVDDGFHEDDEPIEKIQRIRRRPPDFVTNPHSHCAATVFLAPLPSGEWVEHSGPATWAEAGVCR